MLVGSAEFDPNERTAVFESLPVGEASGYVRLPGADTARFEFIVREGETTDVIVRDVLQAEGLLIHAVDATGQPLPDVTLIGSAESVEGESIAYPMDGSPPIRRRLASVPSMRWPLRRLGSEDVLGNSRGGLRFYCSLPPGRWALSFGHEGFEPVVKHIERRAGELLEIEVVFVRQS